MKKRVFISVLLAALLLPFGIKAQQLADYSVVVSEETFTSIASSDNLLSSVNGDYGVQTVELPFTFDFGETTLEEGTTITVRADGYIYFDCDFPGHNGGNAYSSTSTQYNAIVPVIAVDGKVTANGDVSGAYTATTEDANGNAMFVIEWKGVSYYGGLATGNYHYQLRLHANGNVSAVYDTCTMEEYGSPKHNFFMVCGTSDKVCLTGSWSNPIMGSPSTLTDLASVPQAGTVITYVRPTQLCPRPYGLTISEITTSGATASWTARGEESQWMVYVDGEQQTTVNETSYTIEGVSASSNHTFGVAAVCDADNISGITSASFRTACDVVSLPYSEDFEEYGSGTGARPDCWAFLQGYSSYPYISTSYSHTGTKSYYFYTYNSSQPNFVTTPKLAAAPNQLHVVFWARRSSSSPRLEAGIMTDTADVSTFHPILNITGGETNIWTEYEFYTDTLNVDAEECFVAFRWIDSYGNNCYLDDVDVEIATDCRRPESAQMTAPTYEGATISWTDLGTAATSYVVRVATTNNINDANAVEFDADGSPFVITGLNSSTTYHAWVSTVCDATQTLWRYAGSFTTEQDCYPVQNLVVSDRNMTSALVTWDYQNHGRDNTGALVTVIDQSVSPADTIISAEPATGNHYYIEGLEAGHNYSVRVFTVCDEFTASYSYTSIEVPACGRQQGTTTTSYAPTYNASYSARNSFTMSLYPASLVENLSEVTGLQWRISSTPSGGYNRQIKVWLGNTDTNALGTNANAHPSVEDMTLVYEGNISLLNTGWTTINFEEGWQSNGGNVVVAVLCNSGESYGASWGATYGSTTSTVYWYTSSAASAIDPEDLTGASSSTTSYLSDITFMGDCQQPACLAPLATVEGTTENSASLKWYAGSSESNWTVEYRVYGESEWNTSVASTTSTTATVTGLDASTLYQFRVGSLCSDDTLYSAIVQGRTLCDVITLPFTEGFEGWNTGEFPTCWYKVQASGNYPYTTSTSHEGSRAIYMYGTSTSGYVGMIASPVVPTDANNIKVTFWVYNYHANPTNGRLKVGVITDPTDPSSFIECTASATGISSGSWTEYEFYTDNVTVTGQVHVAFKFDLNSSTSYGYIDDITIAQAGNCRKPNTPSRDNIGYYSVDLHWNDVNQGSADYEVRYSTTNDVEAEGYQTISAQGSGVSLAGLQNGQTYYAWVRPVCSTNADDWLAIPSFTTQVSCYSVTGVTMDAKTFTTASVRWTYSTNGIPASGVLLTLHDNTDDTDVVSDLFESSTNHIFTDLASGHSFTLYLATLCNPDTSVSATFNFSLEMPSCGELEGTSTTQYVPYYGYYKYGYSQSIYDASLFAGNDTLFGISYYVNSTPSDYYQRLIDVYIGTPDDLTTLDTNNYMALDDLTLVAEDYQMDVSHTGWTTILFDTPYELQPDANVLIAVRNHTGNYSSLNFKSSNTTNYNSVYWYTDTDEIDPANPYAPLGSSNSRPSRGKTSDVPLIQVLGDCDLSTLCSEPVLVVTGTATNSVSLQWAADNATSFRVEYRTQNETEWTTAIDDLEANTYTVDGLNAATTYQFRVASLCTSTLYSAVKSALTECDLQAVPVTYTFASELSPCWTLSNGNVYRSSNSLYWTYTNYNYGRAVLPETAEPVNTLMAVIRARYSSYSGANYNLLVGVGNSQGNNVVWVDTLVLTTTATEYEVYFDSYTGEENRIVLSKDGGNYIYVEQIDLALNNGCRPVQDIEVSDITTNSATISWTAVGSESQWLVVLNGEEQGVANTTSYTFSNLNSSMGYTAVVRALCSATDTSRYTTATFRTLCESISQLPWVEDFNSYAATAPNTANDDLGCWTAYTSSTSADYAPHVVAYNTSNYGFSPDQSQPLFFKSASSSAAIAVLPAFSYNISDLQMEFWYKFEQAGYGTLSVGYVTDITDPDGSFVVVNTVQPAAATSGATATVSFEEAPTGAMMAFHWENSSSTWYSVCIDNVTVSALGDIPEPVQYYTVSVTSANNAMGTASCSPNGTVEAGTSVTATATANQGYQFVNWTYANGSVASTANPYTFTVNADVQLEANFEQLEGIDDVFSASINLYPNPAATSVTLDGLQGKALVEVVDMNGRKVMSAEASESLTLDVSGLAKGSYFVRITAEQTTAVRKLVVK